MFESKVPIEPQGPYWGGGGGGGGGAILLRIPHLQFDGP